jgi:hypothetical protein
MTAIGHDGPKLKSEVSLEPREAVSVKDAARELEIPAWRIYRMNRTEGPLRFVQHGRRIFIETSSLDSYTGRLRRQNPLENSISENPRTVPEFSIDSVEPQNNERGVGERVQHSGQRELIPRLGRPRVVMFISDWIPVSS